MLYRCVMRNDPASGAATQSTQSVDRAVTLLQLIASAGSARVGDLARELGVHKSTVSRLLTTLERRGIVNRVDDQGTFELGSTLVHLATAVSRPQRLIDIARPTVLRLANDERLTVCLSRLIDNNSVVTIDQTNGPSAIGGIDWVGRPWPAHTGAAGKILLAHLGPDELTRALSMGLRRYTQETVCDVPTLRRQLTHIRQEGIAIVRDEHEVGLSAIAAPVYAHDRIVAAISLSGPTSRFVQEDLSLLARKIHAGAAEISARNGAQQSAFE